jgi:hypothetical protein
MVGSRKFWQTILGLVIYGILMVQNPHIDAFNLGLGIGSLLTPTAMANIFEHRYANGKGQRDVK